MFIDYIGLTAYYFKEIAAYNKTQSLCILPPGCSVDNVYFNSSNKLKLRPQRTGSRDELLPSMKLLCKLGRLKDRSRSSVENTCFT